MKKLLLLIAFCSVRHGFAQAAISSGFSETAAHCISPFTRTDGTDTFYSLRNACPSDVNVYFVLRHPHPDRNKWGSATVKGGGGIHKTYLIGDGGIELYACIAPKLPRNANGQTPRELTNGYTCK